jgi:hypothetical protein
MPKGNWMYGDNLGKDKSMPKIAIGRKPNYINTDKDEIVRIIEGKKDMSKEDPDFDIKAPDIEWTQENTIGDPLDLDSPIGEKPWPLSHDIKSIVEWGWRVYMWIATVFMTVNMVLYVLGIG